MQNNQIATSSRFTDRLLFCLHLQRQNSFHDLDGFAGFFDVMFQLNTDAQNNTNQFNERKT